MPLQTTEKQILHISAIPNINFHGRILVICEYYTAYLYSNHDTFRCVFQKGFLKKFVSFISQSRTNCAQVIYAKL